MSENEDDPDVTADDPIEGIDQPFKEIRRLQEELRRMYAESEMELAYLTMVNHRDETRNGKQPEHRNKRARTQSPPPPPTFPLPWLVNPGSGSSTNRLAPPSVSAPSCSTGPGSSFSNSVPGFPGHPGARMQGGTNNYQDMQAAIWVLAGQMEQARACLTGAEPYMAEFHSRAAAMEEEVTRLKAAAEKDDLEITRLKEDLERAKKTAEEEATAHKKTKQELEAASTDLETISKELEETSAKLERSKERAHRYDTLLTEKELLEQRIQEWREACADKDAWANQLQAKLAEHGIAPPRRSP